MRLSQYAMRGAASGALAFVLALSAPVLAHDGAHDRPAPMPNGAQMPPMQGHGMHHGGYGALPPQPQTQPQTQPMHQVDPRAREAWLAECRQRVSYRDNGRDRDNGVGGAIIGGLAGGVIGNRIAGRGNRVVGTVAGAVVGGAVGMAIDKAEDGRTRENYDYCEAYLEDYYASAARGGYGNGYGYPQQAYGYGYAQPMMMVPVYRQHGNREDCVERVVVEEMVPVRRRAIHRPAPRRVVPDKRIRIAPDKRVPAS